MKKQKQLFFVGNQNTDAVLLQDGKGRFYVLRVKHGKLVVNRDRFPILNDYRIPGEGVIQLPSLEIHQEQGGGKLSLFSTDPQRLGDVCKVGTLNHAFAYEPDWEGICVIIDGFFVDDIVQSHPGKNPSGVGMGRL